MKSLIYVSATALMLAMSPAFAAAPHPAKVEKTALGSVLANQKGMTLYTFKRDAHDKSNCAGKCAVAWPPFAAPASAKAGGHWSVVTRPDHMKQWAYKGRPLYTWKKDIKPGETTGNGLLKGAWQVARP